ncbi:hypothetical protein HOD65_01730, partial [bacterium]|nr:hypothetical protein [bacterium]
YKILLLLIISLSVYGDIVSETGIGISKNEAIENAKYKVLITYNKKISGGISVCNKLPLTNVPKVDSDNYKVTLINTKDVSQSLVNKELEYQVNTEFDIEVINDNIEKDLLEECESEYKSIQLSNDISVFLDRFHMGMGLSGWPVVYGAEIYGEYRVDSENIFKNYSIYLTYAYHQYQQVGQLSEETDYGSVTLAGVQVRLMSYFILGYENVIQLQAANYTVEEPTNAFIWGFVYAPKYKKSKFEFGLLFKDLNSKSATGEDGITGGLFMRYKLF